MKADNKISHIWIFKTFDKVAHKQLLSKLGAQGVSGNIHNRLVDWL